jgi:hypothetical protein
MPELINWKPAFLKELAISPNVSRAARAAGVKRRTAYFARESDPEFAADWDDVIAESVDGLEVSAFRRAELESDVLAIFLLKSHRRATYGDVPKVGAAGRVGKIKVDLGLDDDDDGRGDDPAHEQDATPDRFLEE